MAGEDYSVKTKVTADVSDFEKGMNKAEKSLKGFSEKLANSIDRLGKKGLVGSVANVTLAMQGLTKSFSTVIKFTKDVGKAINDCTEAYKSQIIAERALDTAIQNNPFVTGESSKALKEFASEMQRVSNYGDEELIPMMANLVSLGRTESETMQIMSVALDMSAGMGISLDSAITQLNATLNGSIGRLGQQNAELKSLSEEELRSGRAVEILGEKFKGFSSATADTSKQLQNIKGDFKEALGQFTLPSSDLWNKFWAGFYQKGIEAINKINAFMDSQIIGKKLANAITEQIARINPADIGGRIDYTRSVLKVIGDNELEALKNYLSGLRTLSAEQDIILKRIKAEEDSRYQSSINAKQEAEDKKRQADEEAKITAEAEKQNEISKKKTDWASKLLDQRIEMLETERDRAMQLAEEEGKESYTIWREYNEKILELKLQRLEEEKNKALQEEGLTEEDKIVIEECYIGETKKIYDELGKYKGKKNEEDEKDEKSKFSIILEYVKKYAENVKRVFSNIANTVKDVFSGISNFVKNTFDKLKNIFSTLFEFNVDDALNSLLKIEDAILTFFYETLPKLPNFFESAFSSVFTLIQTLVNSIDWNSIKNILDSIIKTFVTYAPQIMSGIVDVFTNLVTTISTVLVDNAPQIVDAFGQMFFTILEALPSIISNFIRVVGTYLSEIGKYITNNFDRLSEDLSNIVKSLVDGIAEFISSGGWKNLLDGLLSIQKALEKAITDNIDNIVDTIISALPDLIDMLIDSIVSASKTLAKLIRPIIKLVLAIISALIDVLTSDEVMDASLDAVMAFIEAIFEELIPGIIKLIPKLILKIIAQVIKNLPKLVKSIITGLIEAFTKTNWIQVIKDIFTGFIDAFKDLFGIHSPSTLFEGFGFNIVEGLVNGLKGIAEAVNMILEPLYNFISTVFNGIGETITNIINVSFKGLKDLLDSLLKTITDLTDISFKGLNDILGTLGKSLTDLTDISFKGLTDILGTLGSSLKDITEISFKGLKDSLDSVGKTLKDITDGSFKGLNDTIGTMNSGLKDLTDVSFKGLKDLLDSSANVIVKITDSVAKLLDSLKGIAEVLPKIPDINLPGLGGGSSGGSNGGGGTSSGGGLLGLPGLPGLGGGSGGGGGGIFDLGGLLGGGAGGTPIDLTPGGIGELIAKPITGLLGGGSSKPLSTGSDGWDTAIDVFVPGARQIGGAVKDAVEKTSDWVSDAVDSVKDWVEDWWPFANGTNNAPKGLALVGEQGPELVKFNGGEQVLNTKNTQKALSGMGGNTNNFNVTFNNLQDTSAFAMMNQLKQYNRQMAINGVL